MEGTKEGVLQMQKVTAMIKSVPIGGKHLAQGGEFNLLGDSGKFEQFLKEFREMTTLESHD